MSPHHHHHHSRRCRRRHHHNHHYHHHHRRFFQVNVEDCIINVIDCFFFFFFFFFFHSCVHKMHLSKWAVKPRSVSIESRNTHFQKRNERQIRLKNLRFGIKFITVHIDYYSIRIHLEIYSIHCIRKEFKSFIGLSNAAPESFKKTVS